MMKAKHNRDSVGSHANYMQLDSVGDPTSPTTPRINSIFLYDIIEGKNRSHKTRRFKEFIDQCNIDLLRLEEPQKSEMMQNIDRMEKAYNVISAATAMTHGKQIIAWSDDEYYSRVDLLATYGVCYTEDQEHAMTEREIKNQSDVANHTERSTDWEEVAELIKAETNTDDPEFDPKHPCCGSLSATVDINVAFSETMFLQYLFKPTVVSCTPMRVGRCSDRLRVFEKTLTKTREDASRCLAASAIDMGIICRSTLHLLDPEDMGYFEDFDDLYASPDEAMSDAAETDKGKDRDQKPAELTLRKKAVDMLEEE